MLLHSDSKSGMREREYGWEGGREREREGGREGGGGRQRGRGRVTDTAREVLLLIFAIACSSLREGVTRVSGAVETTLDQE